MLIYDLVCSQGHHFEGWFKDLRDLDDQLKKKRLTCPVCGDESISRRPSTFGLVKNGTAEVSAPLPAQVLAGPSFNREQARELFQQWEALSRKLEKDFDDVGVKFTEEALKMHYGAAARRNIRGVSTEAQEGMLKKEGVDFYKFPILIRKNQTSTKKN
ncbi:MAG: DUF1178 family protein [Candidatus Adiutrix sp.]|jgi:hypothetical protein|nr:DUF1178 family protein [Candidatus Adiutrix sp.]